MTADEADSRGHTEQGVGEGAPPSPKLMEYRTGGIRVRLPSEPPTLTPEAARALLAIIQELSDRKRREESAS